MDGVSQCMNVDRLDKTVKEVDKSVAIDGLIRLRSQDEYFVMDDNDFKDKDNEEAYFLTTPQVIDLVEEIFIDMPSGLDSTHVKNVKDVVESDTKTVVVPFQCQNFPGGCSGDSEFKGVKIRTEGTKEEIGDGLYVRGRSDHLDGYLKRDCPMKKSSEFIKKVNHDQDFDSFDDDGTAYFREALVGAQRNRKAEVFQVSNDDAVVAQRQLENKKLEEKKNTDCLVKEQEKVHLGIKMEANITVTGVPGQEGAKGNIAEKKKVKESMKDNLKKLLKYNAWSMVLN
nr:zinc finger, CCHC-type [Tanacetum cinerariifolium]